MNKQAALRLMIACSAAAALVAAGWLLLPKARAAPAGEGGPAAARSQEVSEAEAILREFVPLKEKLDAYATQPGWTLWRYEQHDKIAYNSPRPLPAPHEIDLWLHFNEKRQVFEHVSYALAPELGRVLLGYSLDGVFVSVWNGVRLPQEPYTPRFDLGLDRTLAAMVEEANWEFEVASREDLVEGRPLWVIEMKWEVSAEARQFGPHLFDQPVWGWHERFFVDRETGVLVHYEGNYILEDGTVIPGGTHTTREITANLEPPAEVLEVLRKARMGEDVR